MTETLEQLARSYVDADAASRAADDHRWKCHTALLTRFHGGTRTAIVLEDCVVTVIGDDVKIVARYMGCKP